MRMLSAVALLGIATAGTAVAQAPSGQDAGRTYVAIAMRNAYNELTPPKCEGVDKDLHFKVSSGKTYLSVGLKTPVEGNKTRALNTGERVLIEAITQNGQGNSAGAWYYLGRIYLQKGDIAGADSAFTRALSLAPQCKADIDTYRKTAAGALLRPGADYLKADRTDSAMVLFALASSVYPDSPHAYFYLGTVAYEADSIEKALGYFDKVLATTPDSSTADVRDQAKFNRGVVLIQLQRGQEAIAPLREYITAHADDIAAKRALMTAFQAAGMQDSVAVIAKELEAAGEQVVRTPVVEDSPFNRAAALFNEQKWAEAAALAEQVIAAEPYNRDALYMAARSYYELKNGPKLVKTAEQLVAVDPMNEASLQMLGFGYNLTKNSTKAVNIRLRLNALPVALSSVQVKPAEGGIALIATATGRKATDAQGKALAPQAVTLVFEFLNQDGAVVSTQESSVPALAAAATHEIALTVQGANIVAWRYRQK